MASLRELMHAALQGARAEVPFGWRAEEAEGAALERIARDRPTSTAQAYRQGRWAAIDELRVLTTRRRKGLIVHEVPWPACDGDPLDFAEPVVEVGDRIMEWADRQPDRVQRLVVRILDGATWAEAGRAEGISESRVSQLLRRAA